MNASRIPDFTDPTPDGMLFWWAEMSVRDLLFQPEDNPRDYFVIRTGLRTFTEAECVDLDSILSEMHRLFDEETCEAAVYPIFMKKCGILAAFDA